jgi:Ca2+-transporting ATPase
MDPPRDEAREAVRSCRDAGIRTVMITGDHEATGMAVARMLDIARDGDLAMAGPELEATDGPALARLLPRVSVFARVLPEHKLRIVEALQASGEVVAVTGDGVNDAPALARSDVGVAMGRGGTDVAREAAEIVVTDDDFATIVAAVDEGRVAYRNIQKALLLLLSTGLAEVAVLVLSLLAGLPLPFASVQILWNNVVTEGTITVNLVMEPREGDELRRPPIPRGERLLTAPLLRRLVLMSAAILAVTLGFFAFSLARGVPFAKAQTATFTLLAVCEWFNVLNCRSETRSALRLGMMRNRWLAAGLLLSVALQAAVIWFRPLGRFFHTVPLSLPEVAGVVVVGSVVLWVEEIRKALARRRAAR